MSISTTKTIIILNTLNNWKEWISGIKDLGRGGGVWELCDLALDTEPV